MAVLTEANRGIEKDTSVPGTSQAMQKSAITVPPMGLNLEETDK